MFKMYDSKLFYIDGKIFSTTRHNNIVVNVHKYTYDKGVIIKSV